MLQSLLWEPDTTIDRRTDLRGRRMNSMRLGELPTGACPEPVPQDWELSLHLSSISCFKVSQLKMQDEEAELKHDSRIETLRGQCFFRWSNRRKAPAFKMLLYCMCVYSFGLQWFFLKAGNMQEILTWKAMELATARKILRGQVAL